MRYTIIIISLILISAFNCNAKNNNQRESQYQIISKKNYPISKINKLLIAYKDSLTMPDNKDEDIAFYNLVISKLYYFLGAYNKSIDYGKAALNNYTLQNDTAFMMYALINIGAIYGENNEKNIAFDYFSQIERLAKASNDSDALSYNYINMGNAVPDTNRLSAIEYYDKAEKFNRNNRNTIFYLTIFNGRAGVYYREKKYKKAVKFFLKALNLIDSTHFFYGIICSNVAESYKQLNNIDSSLYYAYKALNINPKFHNVNNMANTFYIIAQDYLIKHKYDSVKTYLNLFKNYNDSIILNKKIEYISKLKVINETDKLIEKNKMQKIELNKYNSKIKYLIVIIFIILLALIVVAIFYKKTQMSYKKIVKESVQSVKMEEELNKLKQELPTDKESKKTNSNIENSDKIFYEIIKLMEEDKLYTDHTFTLNKLSDILGVNRTYVSNVINIKTNGSFIKLVNSYRVKEAKKMLVDDKNKNLTLEAIGKASGFKSTSSFYRVFKTETGVTPLFYVKNKNI